MSNGAKQHAVVTGAGSGIGAAIARALAGAGFEVTLIGRTRDTLAAVAKDLGAARVAPADVTDEAGFAAVLADAEAHRPVAVLVNNAGAAATAPIARASAEQWHAMLAVNLTSVFTACRTLLPAMMARREGRVINIASTAGLKGYPYVSGYCAAKHGVVGLTRALALEAATSGVTVNAICPGYTDTDLIGNAAANVAAKTGKTPDAVVAEFASANPMRRLIRPEEVADTVVWLCRAQSASITGQAIAVAGGEVM